MLKLLFFLGKGRATDQVENFTDKHAITILRQQIRESASAVQTSKKALALAMAQQNREEIQLQKLSGKIADLEERTLIALDKGQEDLARESAEAIAHLEAEWGSSEQALTHFKKETARLKNRVKKAQSMLNQLERGYRLAEVTDKTQKLRKTDKDVCSSSLSDAPETLDRLQNRQA
jgi:phage shock protein A